MTTVDSESLASQLRPQSFVNSPKPLVIFIMGPTAVGKTDLAIALSQRIPVDIISVDSAMIYRQMNIGTAKPSASELAQAPHQLIDICDPQDSYSVADFLRQAKAAIANSIHSDRVPLLVGGTHMYFNALRNGLNDMPATDSAIRAQVALEAQSEGWPAMHRWLAQVDPKYAATLHPNHSQRISRGIEVFRQSGKTMTEWRASSVAGCDVISNSHLCQLALLPNDRARLHQRIEHRFELMMEQGFLSEVELLYRQGGLHLDLPSIRCVGYRQLWQHIDGTISLPDAIDAGIVATRQLAKRQLTWLRKWPDLHSFVRKLPENNTALSDNNANIENFHEIVIKALNCLPLGAI